MHLLAAQPGTIADGSSAVDLGQSPGAIVVLSAADSEIAGLAAAQRRLGEAEPGWPSLRLANLMRLGHNYSVDRYVESVAAEARLVVARILGGRGYWPYGVDRLAALARERGIALALLPGDERPDPELAALSTLPADALHRLWRYLAEGGPGNAEQFLRYAADLAGLAAAEWREPAPLLRAGLHWPGKALPSLDDIRAEWRAEAPVAAILFYRALVQAANTAPIDALIAALAARGVNPLPIFVQSLKDGEAAAILGEVLAAAPPEIVLNGTGFAVAAPGAARGEVALDRLDCPVLQFILAGGSAEAWRAGTRGLDARDIAMNVALPEVDGRIVTRALSFKEGMARDPVTEADLVEHRPVADRVAFVAELARNWLRLRRKPAAERRVALVLANYPNREGRIGNGVGLDTPAGAVNVLRALAAAGYALTDVPADGDALIRRLLAGPTNDPASAGRAAEETLQRSDYAAFFASLPRAVQDAVTARWGPPERDPFFRESRLDCGHFVIPAFRLGKIAVGLQPARGYNIDPAQSYHSPDLVPPHGYLAFYAWLADAFRADAVVQMGKHGNLEWLPGKAVALSAECFPEAALGPLPLLYPFIVNDPGEGTQAKRRSAAVIIDHLTPPLRRAESYGRLAELERLVDEYYEAAGSDPRRLKLLAAQIIDLVRATGLDRDCGIDAGEPTAAALGKLDAYLCELKEMQIRDGLHVFGTSPAGEQLTHLLVALVRLPRGAAAEQASLLRALAEDLALGFDPLDCELAAPWTGPRPAALAAVSGDPWRTTGDTVERLELLARELIADAVYLDNRPETGFEQRAEFGHAAPVLAWIARTLRPAVEACGAAEITGLLAGLDGRFVAPGPSGAPSRGRPEVLPTGRNFYSLDSRAVPTPAAWQLGWKSAQLLVERHAQEHGAYPRRLALSAWGTAAMRTGGDDVAQALALMGARPLWETKTGRVTGFEIIPANLLDRPRVDVTFRVSGFFRDAFPNLIDLVDSAARAVAALGEPAEVNPLAARVAEDSAVLERQGVPPEEARRRAGFRVFGAKPGAYGAGLQALIDQGGWEGDAELAEAYLAWGGYAYGGGAEGKAEDAMFRARLAAAEAVIHNQDNREHDLLDSDDYYQFEGGLAAAIRHLSGRQPAIWHLDHSRPESPRPHRLEDEIGRVVRARAANPKWLAGVMRHGYKGAFEIAATVDYLFAFAATARAVKDHHFDLLYEAYLLDERVRSFMAEHNPDALAETSRRFAEAIRRGLWRPRLNSVAERLAEFGRKGAGR
ncbi:MAG TPA: cobaltochelatase subunit CobN [Stellaceae bacterium]|nr:cobaltochelatase subunit CobN [Stellaceae bacterium]